MARLRNMAGHRLTKMLGEFREMERAAKYAEDKAAMAELCRRQLELLNWAMENLPDRTRSKPGDDTF